MYQQATSAQAYHEILGSLGQRQRQVLDAMRRYGRPVTNKELSRLMVLEINSITPRIFELRRMGLVIEDKKRPCSISGKMAIAWRVTDPPVKIAQGRLF